MNRRLWGNWYKIDQAFYKPAAGIISPKQFAPGTRFIRVFIGSAWLSKQRPVYVLHVRWLVGVMPIKIPGRPSNPDFDWLIED